MFCGWLITLVGAKPRDGGGDPWLVIVEGLADVSVLSPDLRVDWT